MKTFKWFDSEEAFNRFLLEEENRTFSRYVSVKTRNLGKSDVTFSQLTRIFFEHSEGNGPRIEFDGVPYVVVGFQQFDCDHGKSRSKKNDQNTRLQEDHNYTNSNRNLIQTTKKLGCSSYIKCRKLIKFPDYKMEGNDSKRNRLAITTKLKREFSQDTTRQQYKILVEMDLEHCNHVVGDLACFGHNTDKRISEKIKELVEKGAKTVSQVKPALDQYAQLLAPSASLFNRRFYPNTTEIYSHIYRCVTANRYSENDQACVQKMVEDRKTQYPEDNIFFRPASDATDVNVQSMLFLHQTQFQKKLLLRYGQEIVAMDATYRTTKYDIATYFICVSTNTGYQVVATMIIDKETTAQIEEGLKVIKQWNPSWNPQYFVCDYDLREIGAIEKVFDNVLVYLCHFHVEQAWDRWLSSRKNGLVEWKPEILKQLRRIASATEDSYLDEVEGLRNTKAYQKSVKFRNWIEKKWLSNCKRWVTGFRQTMINIRISTTNGVERLHRELKKNYLTKFGHGSTLESQLGIILDRFLPDYEKKYIENNVLATAEVKKYNSKVPGKK